MSSTMKLLPVFASTESKQVAVAYGVFLTSSAMVYFLVADRQFASIQTVAGMSQCFAMVLLTMQVFQRGAVQGISVNSLTFHALGLACRLSSTLWLNGYLPVDASGDWIYQAFDVVSLCLSLRLLAHITGRGHSAPKVDITGVVKVAFIAILVSSVLHANMDKRPIFDTLWMTGVFLTSVAMVPQLLALHAWSSRTAHDTLGDHALTAMTMSQVLSAIYMWHARNDMTCDRFVEGFNHSAWAVLLAHLLPVLAMCDFSQDLSAEAA